MHDKLKRIAGELVFQIARVVLYVGLFIFALLLLGNPWGRWT